MRVSTVAMLRLVFCCFSLIACALPAHSQHSWPVAQSAPSATSNAFGLPGLIDMPTAFAFPDAELTTTLSSFAGQTRGTLSFQITPRLTGTFRYAGLSEYSPGGGVPAAGFTFYDRSFDLHYQLVEERGIWPAIAVGLRDFGGTGVYGSEYVVASRHFGANDQFSATIGLGWGRLGSRGGFTNPLGALDSRFETRPGDRTATGGTFNANHWFRGNAAVFGGFEWHPSDRLAFQLEYSSDTYADEQADGVFTERSPVNLGMTYRFSDTTTLGVRYLYGSELGVSLSFALNPSRPAVPGGIDGVPIPVYARPQSAEPYSQAWFVEDQAAETLFQQLSRLFELEGLELRHLAITGTRARVQLINMRYEHEAQAAGRAARAMTTRLPASVELFEIVFLVEGIPASLVTLRRSDLEELEHHPDGTFLSFGRAHIGDAAVLNDEGALVSEVTYPIFDWGLGPYIETALFDPDDPFRYGAGLELNAGVELSQGLILSGSVRAELFGDLGDSTRVSDSVLPRVRSEAYLYDREGSYSLRQLTLEYFGRPSVNYYSRLSIGYLEEMYAGVSAELLWQPVSSPLGLGIELNHVWQRDFDQLFGLQDYSITTGHVSAYYDLGRGYEVQVDAGRYLAGDWGATVSLDRTFNNGWSIGAFATLTDVSAEDFGEGSFDKGIRLTIPLGWALGSSTRTTQDMTIRPILRDGGARLDVPNRLHGLVRDYHRPNLDDDWGYFWR